MNKLFLAGNIVLILVIAALGIWNAKHWLSPPYPFEVDGNSLSTPQKPPEPVLVDRQPYSAAMVVQATQNNLFRKERQPFQNTITQVASSDNTQPAPQVPPPNLTLRGVVQYGSKRIALLEGDYPVVQPNASVLTQPLLHKGYRVGARIGEYKITNIEKTGITLDSAKGDVLNLKIAKFPTEQIVPNQANQAGGQQVIRKTLTANIKKSKNGKTGKRKNGKAVNKKTSKRHKTAKTAANK